MLFSKILPIALLSAVSMSAAPAVGPQKVNAHSVTCKSDRLSPVRICRNLNPALASAQSPLDESFESPDKTFPEGWSLQLTNANDWMIYMPGMLGVSTTDGYYAAMATCLADNDQKPQLHEASWLISPEFTPAEGNNLMFDLYFDVRSLYVWATSGDDKTIDEEDGLILKRINAENMKICISVDGGEWIVLKDLWEEFGNLGYWTINDEYNSPEFRPFSFSLSEYAGKKVKVGFCHSYLDERGGHGMFLDAVKVGLPPIATKYSAPFGTMFWGMSNEMQAMAGWAQLPYYTDLTWTNGTFVDDASFAWNYSALNSEENFTANTSDLTVNYKPDYSTDPEARYTIFTFPTLNASLPGGSTGSYTYADGEGMVLAGIDATLPTRDGDIMKFGMSTFDQGDDVQVYNADFDVPAWGKNAMTKDWWTNHYFEGDQMEGDYTKITSNINFFYNNGATIVIDGVRVAAIAEYDNDAEFKMELIALNDDFTLGKEIASKTIKGSEIIKIDASLAAFPNSVMIPFTFDAPVVISNTNFIAKISGFDSDKVRYYAPLQSWKSADLCYGFSTLEICAPSMGNQTPVESMVPTATFEDLYNSFAFYLDASYPYLKGSESVFEATEAIKEKTFAFDSSYPASELKVADADGNLPEWISIEKNGSFGNTAITVKVDKGSNNPASADLFVSAPGVSHKLSVKQWGGSGVDGIVSDSPVVERSFFDLTGRRLTEEPTEGIYIIRSTHADGKVSVVKATR